MLSHLLYLWIGYDTHSLGLPMKNSLMLFSEHTNATKTIADAGQHQLTEGTVASPSVIRPIKCKPNALPDARRKKPAWGRKKCQSWMTKMKMIFDESNSVRQYSEYVLTTALSCGISGMESSACVLLLSIVMMVAFDSVFDAVSGGGKALLEEHVHDIHAL
eukprot:TRINITY_DN8860_c0_g1_i1.p2 TRINITY_DN8860_c0_g1~~TRINITY_DN8860_c0_g1_i1.p2  ORF type:complete len:161 (+),score=6.25 TRINITY_DN8860_c0_g1_i1:353-835(+)